MPPSAPCPSVNSRILNPSYPSYTKSSAKATSLLNPSTSSPTHRVSRLPPPAPNLTKFDSLFGKRLLKFRYELSSLRLLVSSTVLQLLSSCSDSSGHSVSPVQGQLFILPLLLHTSFHPVSSCLLVLSPPGTPRLRALLADGHLCLRASLPSGFLAFGLLCRRAPLILTHTSFFPFFTFPSPCQTALAIGLDLHFRVSKNYPANLYQNRTSPSNSLLMRPFTIQTSCATVALIIIIEQILYIIFRIRIQTSCSSRIAPQASSTVAPGERGT